MGFFSFIKKAARSVGKGIGKAAKFVGKSVVDSIDHTKDFIFKPLSNIPVVGKALKFAADKTGASALYNNYSKAVQGAGNLLGIKSSKQEAIGRARAAQLKNQAIQNQELAKAMRNNARAYAEQQPKALAPRSNISQKWMEFRSGTI